MRKALDLCYLVTMGLAVVVLTYVDGEEEEESTCLLSRVCQSCRCHINGHMGSIFCPDPGVILESVHITGGMPGCTTVDIDNGLLSSFQTRTLKLRHLNIRTLRNDTFQDQPFLEELDLQHNIIETIENGTLNDVTRLRSLDLTSNRLAEFPLSALTNLTNLTSLILTHNKLTRLEYPQVGQQQEQQQQQQQHLIKMHSLEELHLKYNKITRISVEFINMFPKLSILKLHQNRLVCDCHMAWLREFRKCMCVISYGQPCRQPQSNRRFNLLTYPLQSCPTSGTALAICSNRSACVVPIRTKPVTTRKSPGFSGTWGDFGDSAAKTKTPTTRVSVTTTTTTKTTTMATTPTLETTDIPRGVVCSGTTTRVKLSTWPVTLGLALVLCIVSLQKRLIL